MLCNHGKSREGVGQALGVPKGNHEYVYSMDAKTTAEGRKPKVGCTEGIACLSGRPAWGPRVRLL